MNWDGSSDLPPRVDNGISRVVFDVYIFLWIQELKRNVQREYAKLLTVMQAYAVICTGVRFICTNQVTSCSTTSYEVTRRSSGS